MNARDIVLASLYASLYATTTIILGLALGPLVYGPIQIRLSDALLLTPIVHGVPAIMGLTIGCFIANAYVLGNPIDMVLGSIANLVAGYFVFKMRRRGPIFCSLIASLTISLIVGSYLPLIIPEFLDAYGGLTLMAFAITYGGIFAGELISTLVLGVPLIKAILNLRRQ